jgi:hypothetical protein
MDKDKKRNGKSIIENFGTSRTAKEKKEQKRKGAVK